MSKAKKILFWLDENFEEFLMIICLIMIVISMFVQIIFRYILKSTLTWPEEICRYLYVYTGFLSIGHAIKHKSSIRIDSLLNNLKPKSRHIFEIITYVLCAMFMGYLLKFVPGILAITIGTDIRASATRIPLVYVQIIVPIGLILGIIRSIEMIIKELTALKNENESNVKEVAQ